VINWRCPRKSVQRQQADVSDRLASHVLPTVVRQERVLKRPTRRTFPKEGEWKRNMIRRGEGF